MAGGGWTLSLRDGYVPPRLRISAKKEGPTWPQDTEIMIHQALLLLEDRGED